MTTTDTKKEFNVTFVAQRGATKVQITSFAHLQQLCEAVPESRRRLIIVNDQNVEEDHLCREVQHWEACESATISLGSPHKLFKRFLFGTQFKDNAPFALIKLSDANQFYWCSGLMFVERNQCEKVLGFNFGENILIDPIAKTMYLIRDDFHNTSFTQNRVHLYHTTVPTRRPGIEKAAELYQQFSSLDLTPLGLLKAYFEKQSYPMVDPEPEPKIATTTPIISEPLVSNVVTPKKLPFNLGFRTYPHGDTTDVTITSFAHIESLIEQSGKSGFVIRMIDDDSGILHCQSRFCQYRLLLDLPLFFPEFTLGLRTIEYSEPKPNVQHRLLNAYSFGKGHHVEINDGDCIAISCKLAEDLFGISHRVIVNTDYLAVYVDSENKYESLENLVKNFNCFDFIQPSHETYKDEWFVMAKRLRTMYNSLVAISKQNDEVALLRGLFERNEWPMVEPVPEPEPEPVVAMQVESVSEPEPEPVVAMQVEPVSDAVAVSEPEPVCKCTETLHGTQTVNIALGDSGKMMQLSFNWVIQQ